MNAKEYMHNIRKVRRRIRSLREQIERDTVLSSGLSAIRYDRDRVQTSTVGDRMAEIVAKIMETTNELEKEIHRFQLMEEDAISLLSNLKEEHERVLVYHYLDGVDWQDVADMMGYHDKYIYDVKNKALEELDEVLKEKDTISSQVLTKSY